MCFKTLKESYVFMHKKHAATWLPYLKNVILQKTYLAGFVTLSFLSNSTSLMAASSFKNNAKEKSDGCQTHTIPVTCLKQNWLTFHQRGILSCQITR